MTRERWFGGSNEAAAFDWSRSARELGVSADIARPLYIRAMQRAADSGPRRAEELYLRSLRDAAAQASNAVPVRVPGRTTLVLRDGKHRDRRELERLGPGRSTRTLFEAQRAEDAAKASAGRELPAALRGRMEHGFGERFDDVELHRDSAEVERGQQAFTRDRQIHLEPGAVDLESAHGEHVVAHELAHVAQQARPAGRPATRAALEADAHQAAQRVLAGQVTQVRLAAPRSAALAFSHGEASTVSAAADADTAHGLDIGSPERGERGAQGAQGESRGELTGAPTTPAEMLRSGVAELRALLRAASHSYRDITAILAAAEPEIAAAVLHDLRTTRALQFVMPVTEEFATRVLGRDSIGRPLAGDVAAKLAPHVGEQATRAARIHTDEAAQLIASAHEAHAVTLGDDIYFGAGEFAPGTAAGDELLTHELTHVAQAQRGELSRAAAKGLGSGTALDAASSSTVAQRGGLLEGKQTIVPSLPLSSPVQQRATSGAGVTASDAAIQDQASSRWVQMSTGGQPTSGPDAVHTAAAQGVATPTSPLPHRAEIQQLFGHHDISAIQAHTGPEAADSARAMGADAFATGNHVILGGRSDLHTVAHEAAHVVQQRGGVQLKGGVGAAGDAYEQHADAVADAVVAGKSAAPLLDQMAGNGRGSVAVQRVPKAPSGETGRADPEITPPKGGIDKTGFIDNSKGANIHTGPAEAGAPTVRDQPLPPATRVFVSGTHPIAAEWWYITTYLDGTMVRGYVQHFRVNTDLPEPTAKLHQVVDSDTPEKLAVNEYGSSVRDGHDLRYYENVLLYVNQQHHHTAGIKGTYQDPTLLGGGGNNVVLVADHRIWLVSPAYAKALEGVVPDGSRTGGVAAKAKRFLHHIEDIVASVTESPNHIDEVRDEYAQAIREHLPAIVGIVAGFIMAEAISAFAAATPTGVGQAVAVVIQLALSAFGAAGAVQAGAEALKHGTEWLTLAWTAKGNDKQIAAASTEFIQMLVAIATAALSALGAKANYGNALKIANSMPIGALPALAVEGGGQIGGAGARTGVLVGPGTGSIGAAGNAMMQADKDAHGGSTPEETGLQLPAGLDKRLAKVIKDVIRRAREGKLPKAGNYHPHFDDATVLKIIKDADAIYQSEGKAGRLIFRKGTDIVVVEGPGSSQGNVITGYGPSGIKGESGAAALGGAAGEGGAPISDTMITSGTIAVPRGRPPIPKAVQVAP